MKNSSLKTGLIGVGDILTTHTEAIKANPEYKLVSICSHSEEKLKKQAAELGVKGYVDYRHLLEDKPDVVLISLPHNLHYQVTLDALEAGKASRCRDPQGLGNLPGCPVADRWMKDLALVYQVIQCSQGCLKRSLGVKTVHKVQVKAVGAETPQAGFYRQHDVTTR